MSDFEKVSKENQKMKDTLTYLLGYLWATDQDFKVTNILANTLNDVGVKSDYIEHIIKLKSRDEKQ